MSGLGRPVSPESTRAIWTAVRELKEAGGCPSLGALTTRLAPPGSDWAEQADLVQGKITAAAEFGLLQSSVGADGAPQFDGPAPPASEAKQDWYCFECHDSTSPTQGNVVGCSTCFRVYHPLCLSMPELEGAEFSCPVCVSLEKPTTLDPTTLRDSLEAILLSVFKVPTTPSIDPSLANPQNLPFSALPL